MNRKHHLQTINISNTWFNSTRSSNKGSAIETISYCNLVINSCIFTNLFSTNEGGAIYHIGPISLMTKCCFMFCTVSSAFAPSQMGGNIFTIYGNTNLSFVHASRCAPLTTLGGDSLYHLNMGFFKVDEFNGTNNLTPFLGCISGAFHSADKDSKIQYSLYFNSSDHNMFESWDSINVLVSYSNFIKNTVSSNFMYSFSSTIEVYSCSFYGNTHRVPYGIVTISNCLGDIETSGIIIAPTTMQPATGVPECDTLIPFITHEMAKLNQALVRWMFITFLLI